MARFRVKPLEAGWLLAAVAWALFPASAAAHKIHVFAWAEGTVVKGQVYAQGGEPIRQAKVTLLDPAGATLGQTTTDDEGEFTFQARSRCDHNVVVDVGAGHGAEYTLPADELPEALPARGDSGSAKGPPEDEPDRGLSPLENKHVATAPEAQAPPATPSAESPTGEAIADLTRQVVALRKQLDAHQQRTRWQDVLGAVGYILGVMGLAFYFLGVRRKEKEQGTT